jgi:hypothetical protein
MIGRGGNACIYLVKLANSFEEKSDDKEYVIKVFNEFQIDNIKNIISVHSKLKDKGFPTYDFFEHGKIINEDDEKNVLILNYLNKDDYIYVSPNSVCSITEVYIMRLFLEKKTLKLKEILSFVKQNNLNLPCHFSYSKSELSFLNTKKISKIENFNFFLTLFDSFIQKATTEGIAFFDDNFFIGLKELDKTIYELNVVIADLETIILLDNDYNKDDLKVANLKKVYRCKFRLKKMHHSG